MKRLILAVALLASTACAGNQLVTATNAEHVAVVSVHATIQAEAAAFKAGAYDNSHHQTYVAALLKVTQSEKALNDALTVWNAASDQPMPAQVTVAVRGLALVLSDVAPLMPTNSAAATFGATLSAAIAALSGGK